MPRTLSDDQLERFCHDDYLAPLRVVPACDFDPDVVTCHARAEEHRRRVLHHGTGWTAHRT